MANPFDQFDPPTQGAGTAVAPNPFDAFDPPPATKRLVTLPVTDAMGNVVGEQQIEVAGPEDTGMAAFGRGSAQGVTLGFRDELAGALDGARAWAGGGEFLPAYERGRDGSRTLDAQARTAHPYSYGAGQVTGGVGAMVPLAVGAPGALGIGAASLKTGMLASARSGAALGGAQGFGEAQGDFGERLPAAGWGGLTGGMTGTVAPVAGAVVGGATRTGLDALAMRGVPVPGLGRRAANTVADTYSASPTGAIEARAAELGSAAMPADLSPAFGSLAQGLASRPEGKARNIVVGALESRDAGTNARIRASLDDNLGPAPVPSEVERRFRDQLGMAGVLYEDATRAAGPVDTRNVLAALGQRMTTAEGAERAALGQALDLLRPARGPDGSRIVQADARNLHSVKQALDDMIEYGDPRMGLQPGVLNRADGATFAVRRALNDALESQVPGYAGANRLGREARDGLRAFQSGREGLRADVHPADYARDFTAAPAARQGDARLGMRADVDQTVGNRANDLQALRGKLQGEGDWPRDKFATTFGDEPAGRVLADIDRNIAFRQTFQDAARGSQTASKRLGAEAVDVRQPSMGIPNSDIALGQLAGGVAGAATAVGVRGARYGLSALGRRSDIARNDEVASFLTLPKAEFDAAMEAVAKRAEVRSGSRAPELGEKATATLASLLLQSTERNSETRTRARQLARVLMAK